jgi:hypothetical protein
VAAADVLRTPFGTPEQRLGTLVSGGVAGGHASDCGFASPSVKPMELRWIQRTVPVGHRLDRRLRLARLAGMSTDHTPNPTAAVTRIACDLDRAVQRALAQQPFDQTGIILALSLLHASVEQLETGLYLHECLVRRSPSEETFALGHAA